MKTTAIILTIIALNFSPLQARLGETLEQCEARYGERTKGPDDYTAFFSKDGMLISLEHWEGKCVQIKYCREEALTSEEIGLLLTVNAAPGAGRKWIKRPGHLTTITTWTTANKTRLALYETIGFSLCVTDLKAIAPLDSFRASANKAAAAKKLKGF